jgi:hypothetical protein
MADVAEIVDSEDSLDTQFENQELANYQTDFYTQKQYAIDKRLFINLKRAEKHAKKTRGDLLILLDGIEGSGKSTIARQVAKVLWDDFSDKEILDNADAAKEKYFDERHWISFLLDESRKDLNSKDAMSFKNKDFTNFLSECRIKHKFFLLCLPSVYDIDSYIGKHRATMLIHCYVDEKTGRKGQFSFYGAKGVKKILSVPPQLRYQGHQLVRPAFIGRFSSHTPVDTTEYERRKEANLEKYRGVKIEKPLMTADQFKKHHIKQCLREWPTIRKTRPKMLKSDFAIAHRVTPQLLAVYIREMKEDKEDIDRMVEDDFGTVELDATSSL